MTEQTIPPPTEQVGRHAIDTWLLQTVRLMLNDIEFLADALENGHYHPTDMQKLRLRLKHNKEAFAKLGLPEPPQ